MEDFIDLQSLYNHLEKNALEYKYSHQIGNLFQRLRDLKYKKDEVEEAEKAQWEVDFFNFTIREGKLNPKYTGTDKEGNVVSYPTLDEFNDRTYEYLIKRFYTTSNPFLKAHYSYILWCSPKKHTKYAKMAIESYLRLIKIYEEKDKKEPQEHFGLDVLNFAKNSYYIARNMGYKIDEIKLEFRRLVKGFNFNSTSSFTLRANLVELMLKDTKVFSKKDFVGFEKILWQIPESLIKVGNVHGAIQMLELGEKVDHKLKKTTNNWRKQIAESYETLMKQAEEGNNLASLAFCQYAIENYKKLKDKDKINELEKKYSELKNSMKLAEFRTEINLTEHIRRCKEVANKVVQNDSEKIIKALMLDKNLLPKYKDMKKIVERNIEKFPVQHLTPEVILDQFGNPAQHFTDEDEKMYCGILKQYDFELRLNKIYLINEIFFAAIRENKLSTSILLKFLNKYSWFGKNISKKLSNNEIIEYNWQNLIAPSIYEYFLQMQYHFLNLRNPPILVLSIDSLTLKIEGLLRDICQLSGITTFHMTKDNKGRNIAREKDIHALLYEDSIKELFDEDDLLFLKFLLVEKAGYNLRHKIAHSLILFQEYSVTYMHLLILALLRLGKYDFVKKENATSHDNR